MSESIDTVETVIQSIREGQYDNDLAMIREALQFRKEQLTMRLAVTLQRGDKVRITSGRPQYIIGATATVVDVMQKYCRIDLDQPVGNYHRGIRCPISMLTRIEK